MAGEAAGKTRLGLKNEKIKLRLRPTPADEHVDGEGGGVGVDDEQQRVQVEALHQQPEEVCHDEVVKEDQDGFTAHLR